MIYLVTNNDIIKNSTIYKTISVEDSIEMLESSTSIQYDSETTGRDAHINDLLCVQFGSKRLNLQIVVDTSSVDIRKYKDLLESKELIGHNLKFDLQFLYNYDIIPTKVYDTMIIEQFLHLGYDPKFFRYSLKAVALRYLGIDIDKTVRGQIIWRGLDDEVIKYAAGDVMYLEDIKELQEKECVKNNCVLGKKIENSFTPVIAYLEWCGICLDINKWKERMRKNKESVETYYQKLNDFVVNLNDKDFLDNTLFGVECTINWNSAGQVIPLLKKLGFKVETIDKETGKVKESAEAKSLKTQKGINDEFLDLYIKYKEAQKDLSTYGEQYIDAINPKTGRIHTTFRALGCDSGRMSCGNSKELNYDLAKYKGIAASRCSYVQLQNLPHDEFTRASFIPAKGNLMTSCDYASLESRLGADIYNEQSMIDEYLQGSGDR